MKRPLIGITVDNCESSISSGRYESNVDYSRMVAEAGGLPLLLPQEISLATQYAELCDGILLTGGDDARTEEFGFPAHPAARCVDPQRQAFELALLDALQKKPERPTLGICFGMQLMSLHAGGRMNQHLPDTLPTAVETHQDNQRHPIRFCIPGSVINRGLAETEADPTDESRDNSVVSSHHQSVEDAGRLRVIAHSTDGVIEAVDDPARPFYIGVQWHPERSQGMLNLDLIKRFIIACHQRLA